MNLKKVIALMLSVVLATMPVLQPISVYAEEAAKSQESANAPIIMDSTSQDESDETAEQETTLSDDASKEAVAEQKGEAFSTDTESSKTEPSVQEADASNIEYVYVDKRVVALGQEQHIAVGFANLDGALVSARLELKASDGQVLDVDSNSVSGSAVLFTSAFSEDNQALGYTVSKVFYKLDTADVEYSIDFLNDDNSDDYSFDVVTADTAKALEESDNEGVSAMVLNDDGSLEVADSVEDAISKADAQGVEESHGNATSPAISNSRARSAISGTRENYLIVAIDPGHGSYDSGAVANGVVEKDANWSIANHFKNELATYTGVTPYLTTSGEEPGLQTRVDRAAAIGADVFVSVHVNSAGASANGAEVWVPNNSSFQNQTHTIGKELGEKIENQLAALGLNRRGVFTRDYPRGDSESTYGDGSTADYYSVIRNARKHGIPGIIVEHAFVTNSSDAAKLRDDNFRRQLGVADATGVAQQYNLGKDSTAKAAASVAVQAHVANLGWESVVYDHKVAGTTGKSFNLEAFKVSLQNSVASAGGVQYQANIDGNWQGWKSNGEQAGTTGQNKAIQAVQMKLTGDAANKYDIWYRVHSDNIGWLGWAKNGASAGTVGYNYGAQAIEVVITTKGASAPGATANAYKDKANEPLTLSLRAHVSGTGWQGWMVEQAGTTGLGLPVEALQVKVEGGKVSGGIETQAHVSNLGWQGWVGNGKTAGTTGRSLHTEAFKIRLTGDLSKQYDVWYRVHSAGFGWLGWAKNGESAGSQGYSRAVEAVEVRLLKKGSDAPGSTAGAFRAPLVSYQAHVQDIGWQQGVTDGALAGTTGRGLHVEALNASLGAGAGEGSLLKRAHVQDIGWQGWTSGTAGTTGRNLAVEAVQFKLDGAAAEKYDVWYRVHSAGFGWLGWAKNGESAGSQGYSRAVEAVEVRLLKKGSDAPGSTAGAFRDDAIMGGSTASVAQMVAAYKASDATYPALYAQKGAKGIEDFCQIVLDEANAEGIRAEIVFAQAMHETGWLRFGGSVKPDQCNFAGLGATSSTNGGATFKDVATGIRAQVQHLKAYASDKPLNKTCVDPRFNLVKRGIAPSLIDLNGRWAVPGTNYGQNIMKIVRNVLKL